MEPLLDDFVSDSDLKMFENNYKKKCQDNELDEKTKFEYAWALIRSRYPVDLRKGVHLLQDLFSNGDEESKRDYLFYLAVGHTKMKDYTQALQYTNKFLQLEPENRQAEQLKSYIKSRLKKEGLMGAAILGGAAVIVGGLVGIGMALAKK